MKACYAGQLLNKSGKNVDFTEQHQCLGSYFILGIMCITVSEKNLLRSWEILEMFSWVPNGDRKQISKLTEKNNFPGTRNPAFQPALVTITSL